MKNDTPHPDNNSDCSLKDMDFSDLIDIPAFQNLMDSFHALTSIPTAILELNGKVLVASGWQKICTDFHRKNPVSASRCLESDTVLASDLNKGTEFNIYKCKNGLLDVATPIIVEGMHLGNLFAGQFLLEEPDIDFFSRQAESLGFDKGEYLQALSNVPIISKDQVERAMGVLTDLTVIIVNSAIDRKKLLILNRSLEHEVHERTQNLEAEKTFSESLINSLPGVMYVFDNSGRFRSWNRNFELITGYSKENISTMTPLDFIAIEDRPAVQEVINEVFKNGHGTVEAGFTTITGQTIPYFFTGYEFRQDGTDYLIGLGLDISERIRAEEEKEKLIEKLQETLSQVKKLSGLLPICASCKRIRDDQGYWSQIESYIHQHSEAEFSHGMCPECSDKLYGHKAWYQRMKAEKHD